MWTVMHQIAPQTWVFAGRRYQAGHNSNIRYIIYGSRPDAIDTYIRHDAKIQRALQQAMKPV